METLAYYIGSTFPIAVLVFAGSYFGIWKKNSQKLPIWETIALFFGLWVISALLVNIFKVVLYGQDEHIQSTIGNLWGPLIIGIIIGRSISSWRRRANAVGVEKPDELVLGPSEGVHRKSNNFKLKLFTMAAIIITGFISVISLNQKGTQQSSLDKGNVVTNIVASKPPVDTEVILAKLHRRQEIREAFQKNEQNIHEVYVSALERNPSLQGRVEVNLVVAATGIVKNTKILMTELGDEEFESELLVLINSFKFSHSKVPEIAYTHTINFTPN